MLLSYTCTNILLGITHCLPRLRTLPSQIGLPCQRECNLHVNNAAVISGILEQLSVLSAV